MKEIFVDSFYYISLLNQRDAHHAAIVEATEHLQSHLVTSVWVLMEVADALSLSPVRLRTFQFLSAIGLDENTTVIQEIEPWYARGLKTYGGRADKNWSLTDCISFEIMADRHIDEALTGDHHFEQAGFRALLRAGK